MTISTELTKIVYQANGSTTVWSFGFPGGPDPNIFVLTISPAGVFTNVTVISSVSLNPPIGANPTSIGGTVVYPTSGPPLPVGWQIVIYRDVPEIQPTSFTNQGTLYPEVIEKAFDYVVMQIQELEEQIDQGLILPPNEEGPLILPPCPQRANKLLGFDANCQPIAVGTIDPNAANNAIRVPTSETIPTLPERTQRPGTIIGFNGQGDPVLLALPPPNILPLFGQKVTITTAYTVVNGDNGKFFVLSGNSFYDFALGDPTLYDANFSVAVFNADVYSGTETGRAKRVMLNGVIRPGGLLWPQQWLYIFRMGSTWVCNPTDQRWKPGTNVTFFVNPMFGSDEGVTDGLGFGVESLRTIEAAVAVANDRVDYGGILDNFGATIQLVSANYQLLAPIVISFPTVGGNPLTIKGADDSVDPTGWLILIPAGLTGIRVDNSASLILKGVKFLAQGNECQGVACAHGSNLTMNNVTFGAFGGFSFGVHMWCFDNSALNIRDINIVGGAFISMVVYRQSTLRVSGKLTVSAGLPFNVFMMARYNSSIVGGGALLGDPTDYTLVGGAGCSGTRYAVQWNSIGDLGAGAMDLLPGSIAGQTGGTSPLHGVDGSAVY